MKCPKCDFKVKGRFCTKCGYEIDPNYELKKRSRRLGCFAIVIIILFVVLSVLAYFLGTVMCLFGPSGILADSSATSCEPLGYLGIEGRVGWIEWILNTLS